MSDYKKTRNAAAKVSAQYNEALKNLDDNDQRVVSIGIVETKEHEDGSATYTFELNKEAEDSLTSLGLELVLYCAAAGVDIQDALDSTIKEKGEKV